MTKTVLITGATGNIGRKLRAHLDAAGGYDLRLLCLNSEKDPDVITADLSVHDDAWAKQFEGVDTVLHVAADPKPWARWRSVQRLNLDLLFNVMAVAQQNGVRRFVFASSNYVLAGYRFRGERLTADLEPWPLNPYGTSKLVGERLGKAFAERYGMSFIAFRIGVCQRLHDNQPGPWIPFSTWGQEMWVSDRDLCRAFQAAIDDESVSFCVYNLVSNNKGMRWELDSLQRDLGFAPLDSTVPKVLLSARIKAGFAYLRDVALPKFASHIAGGRW